MRDDHSPGTRILLIGLALLLMTTIWMALKQNVRLDDPHPPAQRSQAMSLPDMRVDLNSAGVAELGLLPAVGPELAQRIVDDRQSRGPFEDVNDLSRVAGIGPATIQRLREYVVADSPVPANAASR